MISVQAWADAQELWDFQLMGHEPRRCSVAIGLGSHDLGVADVTADLYHRGLTPLSVFTGATSRTTRDVMPKGEAEHYRERALELGVPADAILVEPQARNTGENIALSRALLEESGGARGIGATGQQAVRRAPVLRHCMQGLAGYDVGECVGGHDAHGVRRLHSGRAARYRHARRGVTAADGLSRAGVCDRAAGAPAVAAAYERLRKEEFTSRLLPDAMSSS